MRKEKSIIEPEFSGLYFVTSPIQKLISEIFDNFVSLNSLFNNGTIAEKKKNYKYTFPT
jgi:hypothetical protein